MTCPDRWPYFLHRLAEEDELWEPMTIGASVKIAMETSYEDVSTALSFAMLNAPVLTGSAYGWLEATARDLHRERIA